MSRQRKSDPAAQLIDAQRQGLEAEPGHWSIDPRRAREELARFQLPQANWWILKLVQSAVAAQAPDLTIQLHNRQVQFHFAVPWTLDQLEAEIANSELSSDRGLEHLKRGIWTAVLATEATLSIQLRHQPELLEWDGTLVRRLPASRILNHDRITLHYGSATSPLVNVARAAKRNLALQQVLSEQAHLCPIPLHVDQRRVDNLNYGPGEPAARPLALLTTDRHPVTHRHNPPLPVHSVQGGDAITYLVRFGAIIIDGEHQSGRITPQIWSPARLDSSLTWMLDGVKLMREAGPVTSGGIAVHAFASAEGLATDLSGFYLRTGPQLNQRRQEIWKRLRGRLAPCCRADLTERVEKLTSPLHQGASGLLKIAAVGLLVTGHPILAALSFAGGGYPAMLNASRKPLLKQLDKALARFPDP